MEAGGNVSFPWNPACLPGSRWVRARHTLRWCSHGMSAGLFPFLVFLPLCGVPVHASVWAACLDRHEPHLFTSKEAGWVR